MSGSSLPTLQPHSTRIAICVPVGAALLCSYAWPTPATADELLPLKQMSVMERPRPEFDPVGLHVGSLRIHPTLTLGESYDDNVFAQEDDEVSDRITVAGGGLSVQSNARVPWSLFGNVTSRIYSEHSTEDHTDWQGGGSLTQLVGSRTRATLRGSIAQNHISRDDPSVLAAALEQPRFKTRDIDLDITHTFARGRLSLSTYVASNDYDDVGLAGGGILDQDFRDRRVLDLDLRADLAVGSVSSVFVRLTHGEQRYDEEDPEAGLDRDADNDALYGGMAFQISNLMRGDIGVGVLKINNADPSQEDRQSLAVSGQLEFYVSQLMTATLELRRTSGAADIAGSASYIATGGTLSLDYELRRNLILSTKFSRSDRDYSGISGTDTSKLYSLNAQWLLNRRARVLLGVTRDDQDWAASSSGRSYTQNIYSASVDFKL